MDNLEHRLKCIENLLIVAIDRIDELEAQIVTMNISSFKRS